MQARSMMKAAGLTSAGTWCLTSKFIRTLFMKALGLKCQFLFQEKFGAGELSVAMTHTM